MPQKLYRNHTLTFRVTDKEREMIREKMKLAGMQNMQCFIFKMVLEGRIINVEMDSVKERNRLLSNLTNNINQIARQVNTHGHINHFDTNKIESALDNIWIQQREILKNFLKILDSFKKI